MAHESFEFINIVAFWNEGVEGIQSIFLHVSSLIQLIRTSRKQKISGHVANTYYYLLPELDALKTKQQNHLLSIAIKAEFTFCFNTFFILFCIVTHLFKSYSNLVVTVQNSWYFELTFVCVQVFLYSRALRRVKATIMAVFEIYCKIIKQQ